MQWMEQLIVMGNFIVTKNTKHLTKSNEKKTYTNVNEFGNKIVSFPHFRLSNDSNCTTIVSHSNDMPDESLSLSFHGDENSMEVSRSGRIGDDIQKEHNNDYRESPQRSKGRERSATQKKNKENSQPTNKNIVKKKNEE